HDDLAPTLSLWAPRPMRFGARHKRFLEQSTRIRVLLHANVVHLQLDEAGRSVTELRLATLDGRRFTVRARRFVLACGGLEVARLLLLSNDRHPAGIG